MPLVSSSVASSRSSAAAISGVILRGKTIIATVHKYYCNKAAMDKLAEAQASLKEDILAVMGANEVASAGEHIVRVTNVAGTPSTSNVLITREMIGHIIPGKKGRAGSTRLEVI